MPEVSVDKIRSRLALIEARRKYFEQKSDHHEDKLARHEVWRHNYLSFPYLIGAPDERVANRFRDIFINQSELTNNGQIGMLPIASGDKLMQKFTHMLEEYEMRGGIPDDVIQEARKPILRYFEKGDPIAIKLFSGYVVPSSSFTVKYGRKEFLEPMLREGRIRICPASFYNNTSFNDAIKDDEINRNFFIPTFRERLKGEHYLDFQGHRIDFGHDDIRLPVVMQDYFLYSLCDYIYYRMPTDFESNAALIIHEPLRFAQSVIAHFLAKIPECSPIYGPVTYYDPYQDYSLIKTPELSKHFGYSYQREVRIVLKLKHPKPLSLHPQHLVIGSMADYAELLFA